MAKADTINLFEHKEQIRKTWRAGKKHIIIEGRRFSLKVTTKMYKNPETHQKYRESWINVSPMDGSSVPHAMIELTHQGNMRTVR